MLLKSFVLSQYDGGEPALRRQLAQFWSEFEAQEPDAGLQQQGIAATLFIVGKQYLPKKLER